MSLPIFAVLVAALLLGCAKHPDSPAAADDDPALDAVMATYLSLQPAVEDADGFIETAHCDSLLFSALRGVGGAHFRALAARDGDGRYHRRPLTYAECYPVDSHTTISRDHLLGVMFYAYVTRDRAVLDDLWAYGSPRSWIMGDGDRAVVTLTPQYVGLLAQLIYKLGGTDHATARAAPAVFIGSASGFEAHIQALEIQLRSWAYGSIEQSAKDARAAYVERQPQNPLFQCVAGHPLAAAAILTDERVYPQGHLPTSDERCDEWLPQRAYGKDWQPCPQTPAVTYSGGDLLFIGKLITKGWCG